MSLPDRQTDILLTERKSLRTYLCIEMREIYVLTRLLFEIMLISIPVKNTRYFDNINDCYLK